MFAMTSRKAEESYAAKRAITTTSLLASGTLALLKFFVGLLTGTGMIGLGLRSDRLRRLNGSSLRSKSVALQRTSEFTMFW